MLWLVRWRWLQEGEMRPQLLDRFGMSVNVATLQDKDQRTAMVLDRCAGRWQQAREGIVMHAA